MKIIFKTSSRLTIPAAFLLAFFCIPALKADATSINYFETIKEDPAPETGKQYYMRHNIMYEEGSHATTNYWRGALLPVNTKVTLLSLGRGGMLLQVDGSGEKVRIEYSKHGRRPMPVVAKNMLSARPVPIEKFDAETQGNIKSGNVTLGMTKEQVVIARGYPPAHKTPSIDGDKWQYWSSRYVIYTYVFKNGILTEGRGLR
jgi:hypothetical protein